MLYFHGFIFISLSFSGAFFSFTLFINNEKSEKRNENAHPFKGTASIGQFIPVMWGISCSFPPYGYIIRYTCGIHRVHDIHISRTGIVSCVYELIIARRAIFFLPEEKDDNSYNYIRDIFR